MGRDYPRRGAVVHSTVERRRLPQTAARRTRARAGVGCARAGASGNVIARHRVNHRGMKRGNEARTREAPRTTTPRGTAQRTTARMTKRRSVSWATTGRPRGGTRGQSPTASPPADPATCRAVVLRPIQARSGSSATAFPDSIRRIFGSWSTVSNHTSGSDRARR